MSHCSSDSSLLQRHRPSSLPPQPHSPEKEYTLAQRQHLETHESRHLPETFITRSRANSHSQAHPSLSSIYINLDMPTLSQPIASTSSGMGYLNQDPTSSTSTDIARPEPPCCSERQCTPTLAAVRDGSIGIIIPREQWQPDCSSALCTYPFCSTIFTPASSYFALGPRRHHCRKCGLIFCSSHSNNKALLYDAEHKLVKERVCDMCINKNEDDVPLSRYQSPSSVDGQTDSSISSEHLIVTPSDLSLSRTSTRYSHSPSSAIFTPGGSLAPVEGWMDKDGVISLYPLAFPPTSRQTVTTAAKPLFAPSKSAIRTAKEKEDHAVFTLRNRRAGRERESDLQRSRRGSMESVEEELAEEVARRSNSQSRMALSTF